MQLVLLDHGLYKQIDDGFRREYAALWRSLILADHNGIRRHSAAMNAGEMYELFACECAARGRLLAEQLVCVCVGAAGMGWYSVQWVQWWVCGCWLHGWMGWPADR